MLQGYCLDGTQGCVPFILQEKMEAFLSRSPQPAVQNNAVESYDKGIFRPEEYGDGDSSEHSVLRSLDRVSLTAQCCDEKTATYAHI